MSFVIVVYSLGIKPVIDNPSGGELSRLFQFLFPHLSNFVAIGAIVLIPICIYGGLFHYKKTGAYAADAAVATEQNPYIYRVVPGKEAEVYTPLWAFTARALARLLEREENISPEEKKQIEEALRKAQRLMTGEAVGLPVQSN